MSPCAHRRFNPRWKRWSDRHGFPRVRSPLFALRTAYTLARPHAFHSDLACGTRRPLLRSRLPRIHFQSFSVDESFVFQAMNQDNITWCEPTCQGVHWPAFSVRFDARSVREHDGVFPLVVDLNPFYGQPIRFIEVIAAGLIGPEDSPSGRRFGAARSQEMSTTFLSRSLGGRTKAKQDRRAPAWCDETRAVAGVA